MPEAWVMKDESEVVAMAQRVDARRDIVTDSIG